MYHSQSLDSLLKTFAQSTVPGCACVATLHGDVVYEGYHGYADLEAKRPVDADTVFRLFSMTKVVISTACMMLFEQGKFLLNDPLYAYFPEYRDTMKYIDHGDGTAEAVPVDHPILVKHILSMTCGLPYGTGDADDVNASPSERDMRRVNRALRENGPYTLREEIRRSAAVPLAFEPGTRWLYGFGSELSAGLVELLTGKPIEDALKAMILEPLGMAGTGMHFFGDIQSRLSQLYVRGADGALKPNTDMRLEEKHLPGKEHEYGCPRLFSTALDFSKLSRALACGGVYNGCRLLGRKTIDLMRQNQLCPGALQDFTSPYTAGYGYGMSVRTLMDPAAGGANASIGEFGWVGGAGTWVAMDPAERFSLVYMHQMLPSEEHYHHLRVRSAAFGGLSE